MNNIGVPLSFLGFSLLGLLVGISTAVRLANRTGRVVAPTVIGLLVPAFFVLVGAIAAGFFMTDHELRTGGSFALGLAGIMGAVILAIIGGVVSFLWALSVRQQDGCFDQDG